MSLRANTPEAREIWATVDAVAARVPEWARPLVEKVAAEVVERIKNARKAPV